SHPHIVTVHDAGVDPGRGFPYIVMEYVPGRSLKEILAGPRRMSLELGLRIIDSLADALGAAHKAGIVHRDIKPANILVRESDGTVKIADFGVARLSASELTRTGTLIGSPAYMSPEQVRGGEIDGRSDLFSLAVVLYEALTGRRPFAGARRGRRAAGRVAPRRVQRTTSTPTGRRRPGTTRPAPPRTRPMTQTRRTTPPSRPAPLPTAWDGWVAPGWC